MPGAKIMNDFFIVQKGKSLQKKCLSKVLVINKYCVLISII